MMFVQLQFQAFDHHANAGELLPKVIVQVEPNAAALLFSYFQKLVLEAFAIVNSCLERGVGSLEFGSALLHAHFQFVVRATQSFLGAAALDELANFAADGGHHIQQRGVLAHFAASEELEHAEKVIPTLNREGNGAA